MIETGTGKPQALLVGRLPALMDATEAGGDLELRRIAAARAPELIRSAAAEVVVLDGALPAAELEPVLRAVDGLDETLRPSLVVVDPSERVSRLVSELRRPPDAVLDKADGHRELIAGIHGARQARRLAAELARREAEVADLRKQLDELSAQMAEELRLASRVQRSLLPTAVDHPRLDVAREFIPFREIGGDYYDFVPLGPHRLAFAIGDVTGKGIAAALLAASLKAAVRAQLQTVGPAALPEDVVVRVDRLFAEVAPRALFASLLFAVFDFESGVVEYVNAGHDYAFRVAEDGTTTDLVEGGTLLGFVDGSYERGRLTLRPGDVMVFYSAGVTDRGDAQGEPYGLERLKEATRRSRRDTARIILYSILGEVQGWSSGTPAQDDATLVVMKHS